MLNYKILQNSTRPVGGKKKTQKPLRNTSADSDKYFTKILDSMNQLEKFLGFTGYNVSALHCGFMKERNSWQSDAYSSTPVLCKILRSVHQLKQL